MSDTLDVAIVPVPETLNTPNAVDNPVVTPDSQDACVICLNTTNIESREQEFVHSNSHPCRGCKFCRTCWQDFLQKTSILQDIKCPLCRAPYRHADERINDMIGSPFVPYPSSVEMQILSDDPQQEYTIARPSRSLPTRVALPIHLETLYCYVFPLWALTATILIPTLSTTWTPTSSNVCLLVGCLLYWVNVQSSQTPEGRSQLILSIRHHKQWGHVFVSFCFTPLIEFASWMFSLIMITWMSVLIRQYPSGSLERVYAWTVFAYVFRKGFAVVLILVLTLLELVCLGLVITCSRCRQ